MKKYASSRKPKHADWAGIELLAGDLAEGVRKLKRRKGKDLIVDGGASFVSSLIEENPIDEYHLIINPAVLGRGKAIFNKIAQPQNWTLDSSKTYQDGITVQKIPR